MWHATLIDRSSLRVNFSVIQMGLFRRKGLAARDHPIPWIPFLTNLWDRSALCFDQYSIQIVKEIGQIRTRSGDRIDQRRTQDYTERVKLCRAIFLGTDSQPFGDHSIST
jgi:hypothetical protein